jgi:Ca-activated chloride channel family protein
MKRPGWFCAVFLISLFFSGTVYAIGRVYARLPNNANSPIYNLRIKSLRAVTTIRDQLAVTSVDQEFANDNNLHLEGYYVFQLPEGAQVHEMYLWINGIRQPFQIKKREDAVVKYQEIVSRIADPAILEQLGPNLFRIRIFPIDPMNTRRIEIVYSQPLSYYKGKIQYTFPLDMRDYTSAPIETASLTINFDNQFRVTAVETSVDQFPAAVKVTKVTDYRYSVQYGVERVAFARDFIVRFSLDRGGKSMYVLPFTPPDSLHEAKYFVYWAALPDTLVRDSIGHREITFIADVSSSMEGERLAQLKDALVSFIDLLTENDQFNIIAFSTTIAPFRGNLVRATTAARDSALIFVSKLAALGLTDMEEALRASLMQSYSDSLHAAILFLTDGQPSWGEIRADSLLAMTTRLDTKNIRFFPIAVGDEADYSLLQGLALDHDGIFTRIAEADSIYLKMKDLYRLLFLPSVKSIAVNFGALDVSDLHPEPIPSMYAGDQLMLAGRFVHGNAVTVQLNGTAGASPVVLRENGLVFSDTVRSFSAVSRYWGAQKIKSLLDLITVVGEQKELVDQVISLSMRYSVLTPYTAFLVVEPMNSPSGGTAVPPLTNAPVSFQLAQNYPNPFNPSTTISYSLPKTAIVMLRIFNTLGQEVALLVYERKEAGIYQVTWNASNVPSGIYFYRLQAGEYVETKKMVLLR